MTPEQIDALTRLVEDVRRLAYGYETTRKAGVLGELNYALKNVEYLFPIKQRGVDGLFLPDDQQHKDSPYARGLNR